MQSVVSISLSHVLINCSYIMENNTKSRKYSIPRHKSMMNLYPSKNELIIMPRIEVIIRRVESNNKPEISPKKINPPQTLGLDLPHSHSKFHQKVTDYGAYISKLKVMRSRQKFENSKDLRLKVKHLIFPVKENRSDLTVLKYHENLRRRRNFRFISRRHISNHDMRESLINV